MVGVQQGSAGVGKRGSGEVEKMALLRALGVLVVEVPGLRCPSAYVRNMHVLLLSERATDEDLDDATETALTFYEFAP
jgi:hypothetical protein